MEWWAYLPVRYYHTHIGYRNRCSPTSALTLTIPVTPILFALKIHVTLPVSSIIHPPVLAPDHRSLATRLTTPPDSWAEILWHNIRPHAHTDALRQAITQRHIIRFVSDAAVHTTGYGACAWIIRARQDLWTGEGYVPVPVDVTAFWRPALQDCPSKHYHPMANRALPAVIFGIVGVVGDLGGQRVAYPRAFERVHPKKQKKKRLWKDILRHVKRGLAEDEILTVDAGVKVNDLQMATIDRYVLRLANNFTARRNFPAARSPKGRPPVYGERIRPLERTYKGKTIAKSAPDRVETWMEDGIEMRAEIWEDVILPSVVPSDEVLTFQVYAIYDPAYPTPWLLATPLKLKAASVKAISAEMQRISKNMQDVTQSTGAAEQMANAANRIIAELEHRSTAFTKMPTSFSTILHSLLKQITQLKTLMATSSRSIFADHWLNLAN